MAIAQKLADEMGVELELVDMSFDGLLISLQKGDFDMVIAGLSATDERKKSVDFSRGVLTDGQQVILIKKTDDEKFNTTEDLATYACGCQNGTIQQGFAEKYSGADNFIALSKFNDLVMELQSGKLDAVYVDYLVGLSYCTGNPDLMIKDVGIEYESQGVAVAFKKGNEEAVEYVNAILDEIVESGEFDQYVQDAVELAASDLME